MLVGVAPVSPNAHFLEPGVVHHGFWLVDRLVIGFPLLAVSANNGTANNDNDAASSVLFMVYS